MPVSKWIWVSAAGLAAFVVVVATQSLLAPGFDSARQMISEYVHTSDGPLMTVGFLAWSVSLAALAYLTVVAERWGEDGLMAQAQQACLLVAAVSVLLLACFATDRGAQIPGAVTRATAAGHLHDAASTLASVSLLAAVLIGVRRCHGAAHVPTLLLLALGLASVLVLLAAGDPVPGIRQRALVATACLWQAFWLWELGNRAGATSPRSSADSRGNTS
jgi:hypothetical protein